MRNIIQSAIVAAICVVAIPPLVGAATNATPDLTALAQQLRIVNQRVTVTQDRVTALSKQLKAKAKTSDLTKLKKSVATAGTNAASAGNAAAAAQNAANAANAGVASLNTTIAGIPRGPKAWAAVDGDTEGIVRMIASSGNVTVRETGTAGTTRAFCLTIPGIGPLTNPASVSLLETGQQAFGITAFVGPGFGSTCSGPNEYWVGIRDTINNVTGQYNGAFFFMVP